MQWLQEALPGYSYILGTIIHLLDDVDPVVRQFSVECLEASQNPRSIGPLIFAASDNIITVRESASSSLLHAENEVLDTLYLYGSSYLNVDCFEFLIPYVDTLLRIFSDPSRDLQSRNLAANFFSEYEDPRSVDPLIKSLLDSSLELREYALLALAHWIRPSDRKCMKASALYPMLFIHNQSLLSDPDRIKLSDQAFQSIVGALQDPELRKQGAISLGEIKDFRAVVPLIRFLHIEPDSSQSAIVDALAAIGDTRAVPPLVRLASSPSVSEPVRRDAIYSLSAIGDARAIDPIVNILESVSESMELRYHAASALSQFKTPASRMALVRSLRNGDDRAGDCVRKNLEFRFDSGILPLLIDLVKDSSARTCRRVLVMKIFHYYFCNKNADKKAIQRMASVLIRLLQDPYEDEILRNQAALSFLFADIPCATRALIQVLVIPKNKIVDSAYQVLSLSEDPGKLSMLLRSIKDPSISPAALIMCLELLRNDLGSKSVVNGLTHLSRNNLYDPDFRNAVSSVLISKSWEPLSAYFSFDKCVRLKAYQ
jgi:HEAT repeat protein